MIPKFTWVTIFLSVFITVAVTEVVIHEYTLGKQTDLQSQEEPDHQSAETTEEPEIKIAEEPKTAVQTNSKQENPITIEEAEINELVMISAKVKTPLFKRQNFNGKIFNFIETEYSESQVLERNVFDGEKFIGTVYEIQFDNPLDKEAAYAKIKSQAATLASAAVNENNTFGEKSFYINDQDKKNTVYVITEIGNTIHGFQYPHTSHEIFKSIAQYFK